LWREAVLKGRHQRGAAIQNVALQDRLIVWGGVLIEQMVTDQGRLDGRHTAKFGAACAKRLGQMAQRATLSKQASSPDLLLGQLRCIRMLYGQFSRGGTSVTPFLRGRKRGAPGTQSREHSHTYEIENSSNVFIRHKKLSPFGGGIDHIICRESNLSAGLGQLNFFGT
jgi:hypothetical protein